MRSTCLSSIAFVCLACVCAAPVRAQCCEKSSAAVKPSAAPATKQAAPDDTPAPAEWLVLAARRVADEVSRLFEKVTYSEYATQWTSWCAGNRRGAAQPCTPKCCAKPEEQKPATDTRCCRQPCPAKGTQPGGNTNGS